MLENAKLTEDHKSLIEENSKVINSLASLKEALYESNSYVAVSNDPIDVKLGEALNKSMKDSFILDLIFNRQGDGSYMIGTKKYIMKLDSKENLIVRAGTGFVTVQEVSKSVPTSGGGEAEEDSSIQESEFEDGEDSKLFM